MYNAPGTSVLGTKFVMAGTAGATTLPLTGLPLQLVWLLLVAALFVTVGVTLLRVGRLASAERAVAAPAFRR